MGPMGLTVLCKCIFIYEELRMLIYVVSADSDNTASYFVVPTCCFPTPLTSGAEARPAGRNFGCLITYQQEISIQNLHISTGRKKLQQLNI